MQMNVVVVFWGCRDKSVAVVNVKPLQMVIVEPMCWENQRLALADLQCSCNGRAIAPCGGAMRCAARSSCQRQHAWMVTSSKVRTMVTRRRDQSDAGHIVRGTWTMVMRAARDRDPNIAQDHAIRR